MKKKIVAVTGSRSEYDMLYSVLNAMDNDDEFGVSVIVTGAHLSEYFGYTVNEIENDGFKIAGKIHNLINSDKLIGKAKSSGLLLSDLSELLYELKPDFVLVAGDREESIITGVACTYLEVPLIHIAGGDRSYPGTNLGDVDEQIRHATTKLANIHFAIAKEHAERIIKMGEEKWRVFCSGNPALDRFQKVPVKSKDELIDYFGFSNAYKPLILVIQHVISSEYIEGGRQIEITLDALSGLNINCIVNYPNSDMGSQKMIEVIEKYNNCPNFKITKNIPREYFVNLIRNIDILIGNSSMAFLEGSYLRLPSINIGNRQRQRLHGGNVVFTDYNKDEIKNMVIRILEDDDFSSKLKNCRQIYGDGTAARKIVHFLKNLNKTREKLVSKDITY